MYKDMKKFINTSNIILIRHGQSEWNKLNKFTGWVDVDLSENGAIEAREAALKILNSNIDFDYIYTSSLGRAIKTFQIINRICNFGVDYEINWRLNERHYGALQGLNKQKMRDIHGDEQVLIWRRSYDVRPPALKEKELDKLKNQDCFLGQQIDPFPISESLKDTYERLVPFINKNLIPLITANKNVLICAHGNSIRAMLKFFEKISDEKIVEVEIPTGKPLLLTLDSKLKLVEKKYL